MTAGSTMRLLLLQLLLASARAQCGEDGGEEAVAIPGEAVVTGGCAPGASPLQDGPQPPASSLQPAASSLQPTACSLQPAGLSARLILTAEKFSQTLQTRVQQLGSF